MTNEEAKAIINSGPVWDCIDTNRAGVEESNKLNHALNIAIAALERDRWISVNYADETSLPQKEKCVMVCAFGTTVGEGWYYGFDGFHHVWKLAVSCGTYWDDEVIAWMPLPEPPKEET